MITARLVGRLGGAAVETITPLPAPVDGHITLPPVVVTSRSMIVLVSDGGGDGMGYIHNTPDQSDATVGGTTLIVPAGTWYRTVMVGDDANPPTAALYTLIPF